MQSTYITDGKRGSSSHRRLLNFRAHGDVLAPERDAPSVTALQQNPGHGAKPLRQLSGFASHLPTVKQNIPRIRQPKSFSQSRYCSTRKVVERETDEIHRFCIVQTFRMRRTPSFTTSPAPLKSMLSGQDMYYTDLLGSPVFPITPRYCIV